MLLSFVVSSRTLDLQDKQSCVIQDLSPPGACWLWRSSRWRSLVAQAADPQNADKEKELIGVLQTSPPPEKAIACKKLAIYGSKAAVPELAKLLTDAELASWARIALEAIPDPAADEALRRPRSARCKAGWRSARSTRWACGAMPARWPCWWPA